jgi:hypothetical protein
MMKTLVLTFMLAFAGITAANAQSKSSKIYDAFSGKEGVSQFSFTGKMIDAINLDLSDDENEEKNVTGDLHEIRFLSYNPQKGDLSGSEFIKKATSFLTSPYKKFEDDEPDDDNAEIWLLGGKKKFTECHLLINNTRDDQLHFIVSFYGDFTVNDLERLKKTGMDFSDDK